MLDNLGESGKLVLAYAQRIAANLHHPSVGPEHLFLGIGDLEDLGIRRSLLDAGLDLDEVCATLRNRLARRPGRVGGTLPLTPEARTVLERAQLVAARMAESHVEAPQILVGLLAVEGGPVRDALDEAGADRGAIIERLTGLVESGDWTPSPGNKGRPNIEQSGLTRTSDVMESLGRDLTAAARAGELSPIVGRDREMGELVRVLLGRDKNNAVLIGEAGVGKTAIVEGLAQRIVSGELRALEGVTIRTIEVGSLVAGTIYRGQFEQRMMDLVEQARNRDDLILFIDEMHMLVGAGESGRGSVDAADILKPALRDLRVIGATTIDEYREHIEPDEALMRRFQVVTVGEPSRDDTITILEGVRSKYEEFHRLTIAEGAIVAAVDLSNRYLHDRNLPDKAFDLIDRACTDKKLDAGLRPGEAGSGEPLVVDADDVAEILSVMLEIPIARLTQTEQDRLIGLGDSIKQRVIGQDHAVDAVVAAVTRARAGVERPSPRPIGVFLFLGPTGVGKTRLARELAAQLFGDERQLVVFDMSQYGDEHTKSDLIGSPPGYVGWNEGGKLTNAVREHPYSVLLLDEMEKAHPSVWNLFLPVFENGRMRDGLDRSIDFRNTVIIMTSNVGARRFEARPPVGFAGAATDERETTFDAVEVDVRDDLRRTFAPEFLNRLDEVVVFKALSRASIQTIVRQQVEEIVQVDLVFSAAAFEHLVERSYNPAMGARPVRRAIQRLVSNPLSRLILSGKVGLDDTVRVGYSRSSGTLTFRRASPGPPARAAGR
ncbi:MAG: ATP-dependent Clp protease ATP-binding subunit [Acidimicrobiales bacterium]|nr:ATP-dependent Clp protease ATP-binding subunit [Acidimicrobiales bacterium]MCB9373815.1 ATP-dependent Clp protease ATP-binding subunit [Microthrixaceae bacterium]